MLNADWSLTEETIIRLPVLLTLLSSLVVLVTALGLYDLDKPEQDSTEGAVEALAEDVQAVSSAFRQIIEAGRWTLGHRFVFFVILAALALDSVASLMRGFPVIWYTISRRW
jgi:hypothetical protein